MAAGALDLRRRRPEAAKSQPHKNVRSLAPQRAEAHAGPDPGAVLLGGGAPDDPLRAVPLRQDQDGRGPHARAAIIINLEGRGGGGAGWVSRFRGPRCDRGEVLFFLYLKSL